MLALLAAFALSFERPQVAQVDTGQVVRDSFALMATGKYLPAIKGLEAAYSKGSEDDKAYIGQFIAYSYGMVGAEATAEVWMDKVLPPDESRGLPESPEIHDAKPVDALMEIVRKARSHQIVILNESHLESRNRAFAFQVARELRKQGFEYFAAETFTNSIFDSWSKGYPAMDIGRYTMDPFFGDLVRQAMKLGYKPMNYEAESIEVTGVGMERINQRDSAQAEHLVNRIIKLSPKAKIFIYCGGAHLTENWQTQPDGRALAWMAARLKKATGIDPLSIEQSEQVPHSFPGAESPEFRYADSKGWLKEPVVLTHAGKQLVFGSDWKDGVDMQVFHPRSVMHHARPDWTAMGDYRKEYSVRVVGEVSIGDLVQAFRKGEPADAVPVDQALITEGPRVLALMLPSGEYRIMLQSANGNTRTLLEKVKI